MTLRLSARADRVWRQVANVALTLAALVGLLSLVLGAAAVAFDVRPLIFRSDSMAPAIPAGSLALARPVPADDVVVDDVVTVPLDGEYVTHRVVAVDPTPPGATVALTLKGDANEIADVTPYAVTEVRRVFVDVPVLGRVIAWLGSPPGIYVLAAYAALLLSLLFRRRDGSGRPDDSSGSGQDAGQRRHPGRHRGRAGSRRALIGAASVSVTATLAFGPTVAQAAWVDTVPISGSTLATHTMVSQAQPTCRNEGGVLGILGSAVVEWPHVDARYEYFWQATRTDNGAVLSSGVVTPPVGTNVGATVGQSFSAGLLSFNIPGVNMRVSVQSRLIGALTWTALATFTPVRTVDLLVGLSMRCGNL